MSTISKNKLKCGHFQFLSIHLRCAQVREVSDISSAKIVLMILWIIDDEIICSCALRKYNRLFGDSMWLQKWMDGWMFFICLPMQIFTKWRTSPHPCERLEPFQDASFICNHDTVTNESVYLWTIPNRYFWSI